MSKKKKEAIIEFGTSCHLPCLFLTTPPPKRRAPRTVTKVKLKQQPLLNSSTTIGEAPGTELRELQPRELTAQAPSTRRIHLPGAAEGAPGIASSGEGRVPTLPRANASPRAATAVFRRPSRVPFVQRVSPRGHVRRQWLPLQRTRSPQRGGGCSRACATCPRTYPPSELRRGCGPQFPRSSPCPGTSRPHTPPG